MINKTHERALKIVLNDPISDFETMLQNIVDVTTGHKNVQNFIIEFFKTKYDLAPPITDSILNRRTVCYNFRNLQVFQRRKERELYFML